jgi:hypothetical protein
MASPHVFFLNFYGSILTISSNLLPIKKRKKLSTNSEKQETNFIYNLFLAPNKKEYLKRTKTKQTYKIDQ